MPRSLSNPEFAQFVEDEQSVISGLLPEQSKVIAWNGLTVLIYIGPNPITVNDQIYPDVYLSDVSDASQLAAISQGSYGALPQNMLDTLPAAVVDTVKNEAAAAGALVSAAGQTLAAGATALAGGLSHILIVALVVLAIIYLPSRR